MFIPGPKRESILFSRSSHPAISKSALLRGRLKVHPRAVPLGMENAFVPQSIRIPEGPSEQPAAGIPSFKSPSLTPPKAAAMPGVTRGLHMPSPLNMVISSSSLICATNSSMDALPSRTSTSCQPLSPVKGISAGRFAISRSLGFTVRTGTFSITALTLPSSCSCAFILSKLSVGA